MFDVFVQYFTHCCVCAGLTIVVIPTTPSALLKEIRSMICLEVPPQATWIEFYYMHTQLTKYNNTWIHIMNTHTGRITGKVEIENEKCTCVRLVR